MSNKYIKHIAPIKIEKGRLKFINTNVEKYIPRIFSRDTTIQFNTTIPRKKSLTIKVRNFQPIDEMDKIDFTNYIQVDTLQNGSSFYVGDFISQSYNKENFNLQTVGGLNFINKIYVKKRKNGVWEHETIEMLIEKDTDNEITIFY